MIETFLLSPPPPLLSLSVSLSLSLSKQPYEEEITYLISQGKLWQRVLIHLPKVTQLERDGNKALILNRVFLLLFLTALQVESLDLLGSIRGC